MNSIWSETVELPKFEKQKRDIKTDVLIIGGGMAGILCAYMLEQEGMDYVLVEADRIGSGITKNTTAKITFQHGMVYHGLLEKFGVERTRKYLEANRQALKKYRKLCKNVDCDFEEKDAYVYSQNDKKILERELKTLETIGFLAEEVEELPLPFPVAGAIRFREQAQFHPLKFLSVIAQGLNIYEHTRVEELTKHTALTEYGKITAEKIIVATHFPFINKHGSYFLKMYQHRSYVIAMEHAPEIGGMYVDEAMKGMSFRNYEDLLLIGGGDHRTGKQGGNWCELERFAKEYYPEAKEKYRWATQDCMTLDGVPYIGRYSRNTPDFYVATGFNKWGMTSAMVAAQILTDMIFERDNLYEEVFSPSRTILRPQLMVNAFEAVKNIVSLEEKRCPHMGCALKWNPQEQSWDCPCHGSRFTKEGKLIDNPAVEDLEKEE